MKNAKKNNFIVKNTNLIENRIDQDYLCQTYLDPYIYTLKLWVGCATGKF